MEKTIISDLLAMSFDCLSSPTLKLAPTKTHSKISGWGFGWYPNDDMAASVVKDTGGRDVKSLATAVSDWRRFRSTTFLCNVRGASKRYSQQDTQPFQKNFGGRDWLFLHNGDLDKEKLKNLINSEVGFLDPVGITDSELAFCYLLQQVGLEKVKRISDIEWPKWSSWFRNLDDLGSADIVLSDGQTTLSFHGENSKGELFFWRKRPNDSSDQKVGDNSVTIDLSDPQDTYRTVFVISSSKLHGGEWSKMSQGQLLVIKRGDLIWSSHKNLNLRDTLHHNELPKQEQQMGFEKTFYPHQAEQAQSQQDNGNENAPVVTNIKSITRTSDGVPLGYRSYKVTHITKYNYSKDVERSTHLIRLHPVEDESQEVVRSTLYFSAKGEQLHYEDVFGNQAIHITVEKPYLSLEVKVESEIKIYATPPDDFGSEIRRTSIPIVWMPWQRQMMLPYLLPPELPESQLIELTNYAMSFVERGDYNLIDTLTEMNKQIFKDFNYVQGSTTNETTPFEVYTSRKGVCQDFANLFICLARLLNIPARYRVGYIYTGAKYENKAQSEASHAWAEVYLPYVGWRGFDPTNGCMAAQEHIRIACGRNYRDATPTGGTIFKGGGTETLNVSVKVEELSTSS